MDILNLKDLEVLQIEENEMIDREVILKAIKDLSKECSKHRDCTTCIFYDETDKSDMCEIKNTDEAPYNWYIG